MKHLITVKFKIQKIKLNLKYWLWLTIISSILKIDPLSGTGGLNKACNSGLHSVDVY